ncbi:MAG: ABC transporter substrate-binding protein [Methanomassiliicoccus sp.]|nr:ABC transporter substrate-binding protein [Methanomassiliicoccus sp.]
MNKRALIVIAVIAVLVVASAAVAVMYLGKGPDNKGTEGTISIIDDRGKTVNLTEAPQRIVSLGSAFTEIIFDLDAKGKVVAVDSSSMWMVNNQTDNITNMREVSKLSVESVIDQDPDLVVIWNFDMYSPLITNMESSGMKVVAFYPKNITTILSTIEVLGEAIGEKDKAKEMVTSMQARIDAVVEKTSGLSESERPKIYLELMSKGGQTVGNGTMSNDLINMAGGYNIFSNGTKNWLASTESIVEKNPDIIIIENQSAKTNDVLKATLGPSVTAVSEDKIYRIDGTTLTTSPRVVDALENMAKWFHPELFA